MGKNKTDNTANNLNSSSQEKADPSMAEKRWFGRGIYGSKDVPIRILDAFIVFAVVVMIVMVVWSASKGGYEISFDTDGGTIDGSTETAEKQVTFGDTYGELPSPEREGYTFDGWLYSGEIITEDTAVTMTGEHVLTAQWTNESKTPMQAYGASSLLRCKHRGI